MKRRILEDSTICALMIVVTCLFNFISNMIGLAGHVNVEIESMLYSMINMFFACQVLDSNRKLAKMKMSGYKK